MTTTIMSMLSAVFMYSVYHNSCRERFFLCMCVESVGKNIRLGDGIYLKYITLLRKT